MKGMRGRLRRGLTKPDLGSAPAPLSVGTAASSGIVALSDARKRVPEDSSKGPPAANDVSTRYRLDNKSVTTQAEMEEKEDAAERFEARRKSQEEAKLKEKQAEEARVKAEKEKEDRLKAEKAEEDARLTQLKAPSILP